MKRILAIILVLISIVSFSACGGDEKSNEQSNEESKATVITNSGETKEMTFAEIRDIIDSNSIQFEDEYVGADITVSSTVTEVGGLYELQSWFDCEAYVKLEAGSIIANWFYPTTRDYAATLSVGDEITVSGKIAMASAASFNIYIFKENALSPD